MTAGGNRPEAKTRMRSSTRRRWRAKRQRSPAAQALRARTLVAVDSGNCDSVGREWGRRELV